MAEQLELEDFDTAKAVFERLKDVPPERRERILAFIAGGLGAALGSPAPASATATPAAAQRPPASSPDIKTFVAGKLPRSDVQFAATVAYFYRFEAPLAERRESINGEALQEAARLAGRKRLADPRVTLNNAKKVGYLDGATRGEFCINSVGENLVAMTLPANPDAAGQSGRARKINGRKGTSSVARTVRRARRTRSRG